MRDFPGLRIAILVSTWVCATFTSAATGIEESASSVALKLDYDLVPRLDSTTANPRSLVDGALPEELPSRVLKVQDQVQAMEQSNADKARLLGERQRLLAGIRGIVRAQDRMIEVLETEVAASAVNPSARTAPAPPAMAARPTLPRRIGPLEIPAWLQPWLVEGGLGLVIIVLLGAVFHLRAASAAKDAELEELSAGLIHANQAAKTVSSAAVRDTASPAGVVGAASGATPAMIPAQGQDTGRMEASNAGGTSMSPGRPATAPDPVPVETGRHAPESTPETSPSKTPGAAPDTEPMADEKADDMDFLFDVFADDEELAKKFGEDS